MVNIWNLKELSLPPVCTYRATSFNEIDIENFHILCGDLLKYFTNYPQLHSESLLLSRIVYRMKQKFRTSKDFKALEKLTKSLQRYFRLNLTSDLQSLKELLPDNYSNEIYLPSKSLVEYVLVRLQGVSKLMEYIIETSADIAHMLTIRIHTGHFWKIGFILFSIVSRIYVICRHILKTIINFYSQLLPISKHLKTVGKVWLPEDYVFPPNLEEWLDINLSKLDQNLQQLQVPSAPEIHHYFNLVDDSDSDIEISDEYVVVKDNAELQNRVCESHESQNKFKRKILTGFTMGEDIGEVIEVMTDSNNESLVGEDFAETIEIMSDCNNELGDVKVNIEQNSKRQFKGNLKKTLSMGKIKKKKKNEKSKKLKLVAAVGHNLKEKSISTSQRHSNSNVSDPKIVKHKNKLNMKSKKKKMKSSSLQ